MSSNEEPLNPTVARWRGIMQTPEEIEAWHKWRKEEKEREEVQDAPRRRGELVNCVSRGRCVLCHEEDTWVMSIDESDMDTYNVCLPCYRDAFMEGIGRYQARINKEDE